MCRDGSAREEDDALGCYFDVGSVKEADLSVISTFQVLTAIALGVALIANSCPDLGAAMKPLGDIFIKAVEWIM